MPDSPPPLFVRVIDHATGRSALVGDFGPGSYQLGRDYTAQQLDEALALAPLLPGPAYDRDAVLAQVDELTSPRKQFIAGAIASMEALLPPDDGSVEVYLRRELALGYAAAVAEVDADMIFGEGKDGREPSQLRGLLVEPNGDPRLFGDDPELVRCAGCGLRGRWEGGVVVNAEGRDAPRWCSAPARLGNAVTVGRLRAHGPWVPGVGA